MPRHALVTLLFASCMDHSPELTFGDRRYRTPRKASVVESHGRVVCSLRGERQNTNTLSVPEDVRRAKRVAYFVPLSVLDVKKRERHRWAFEDRYNKPRF